MERRNLALLCAGVLCFWLFALAFGSAQGAGLRVQVAAGKADKRPSSALRRRRRRRLRKALP